ncbi:MAG: AAA family ATPase [Caldilineaceae bacterium]
MKFPYGISDFFQLIDDGYFYVDRTDRIPLIEAAGNQLLFLRPRRFGKSLLLSMLENYYDIAKATEFDQLFRQLAIGKNPTPLHNQYFVLRWDFSLISASGTAEQIQRSLHAHINSRLVAFAQKYQQWLPGALLISQENAVVSLEALLTLIRQTPYKLYLLIDEYDNFANEVLMGGQGANQKRYETLLSGEGELKLIFKAVKAASSGLGLERVFITGVSPIVISDMTSGYNVAENTYLNAVFNDLCGFWETEVAEVLQRVITDCGWPAEKMPEALSLVRTFYNGYCFGYKADGYVYNPTLVLYFLKYLQREGEYPPEMLDHNLAMDRSKLAYLTQQPQGRQLLLDILNETTPITVEQLASRFGLAEILTARVDTTFMASLLYYLGILTLGGRDRLGKLILRIPNLVVRGLYVERIQTLLLPDAADQKLGQRAAETLYTAGDLQPLCTFIEQHYFTILDNRDYRWANELTLKTAFLTLLYNDRLYLMDSETALMRTYADLTMILRPEARQYPIFDFLFEFKYITLPELGMTREALQQLDDARVKTLPLVQSKFSEAQAKLQQYHTSLTKKYGDQLRLRAYAVVALGFERVVWEEGKR